MENKSKPIQSFAYPLPKKVLAMENLFVELKLLWFGRENGNIHQQTGVAIMSCKLQFTQRINNNSSTHLVGPSFIHLLMYAAFITQRMAP